jgi:hypothetical protein
MSTSTIIFLVAITAYLIWLVIYLLLIDRGLRYCVGRAFGVTIESRFERPVGQPNLLDALGMFSWHVIEPSGWPLRLTVGCIRFVLWLSALTGPIVLAFLLFVWLKDHVPK